MKSAILDTAIPGMAAARGGGAKVQIRGFEIGGATLDGTDYNFDPLTTETSYRGPLVYSGTDMQMGYVRSGKDYAAIISRIPHDAGPFDIGNILISTTGNTPFLLASLPAPHHKLPTAGIVDGKVVVGGWWDYRLMLVLPDIEEVFDFSNLNDWSASFHHVDDEFDLPEWYVNVSPQVSADRVTRRNRYGVGFGINRVTWLSPFSENFSTTGNTDFFEFDGGTDGDNWSYTP